VLFRIACWQLTWTPCTVDTRRPRRPDQTIVLVALVLDVIVVTHWLNVLTIFVLADVPDQQHSAVSYVARVVACI